MTHAAVAAPQATAAAAIRLRGVDRRFGARTALRQVDLCVAPGELLGLVGPNGAGKSTLLRILVGLVRRDAGTVSVLRLDPAAARAALAIRHRCCYLPGETSVYHQMTGRQFLDFALGFHRAIQRGLLGRLSDAFALPLERRVRAYSAGMKQKLCLMATLAPDVPLYLLDEPDRALDASVRFLLREVLRDLHAQGRTIVLSSHHLAEVESLADRLEFLVDGRIVPEPEVRAARAALRRRVRVRLAADTALPPGARLLQREPDGTLVLEVDGEAVAWLATLPAGSVAAAEVGMVRLEDLYQQLTGTPAAAAGGAP